MPQENSPDGATEVLPTEEGEPPHETLSEWDMPVGKVPSWEHPDPEVRFRLLEAALSISDENLEEVCAETGTHQVDSNQLLDSLAECAGKSPRWHAAALKFHARQARVQGAVSDVILEQERQATDTHAASQSLFRPELAEFD